MTEQIDVDVLATMVEGILHEPTQVHDGQVDLSVDTVERIEGDASLDFGGGEYGPADRSEISPERHDPDDEYGWWELDAGVYRATFNESFDPGDEVIGLVQPLERASTNGLTHGTAVLRTGQDPVAVTIQVGAPIEIKENARLSGLTGYRV